MSDVPRNEPPQSCQAGCGVGDDPHRIDRRRFLLGAAVTAVSLPAFGSAPVPARTATFPRKKIGRLSTLKPNAPVAFRYPDDDAGSSSILIKLNQPAGGGVGPQNDVVAFSTLCTHQGASLRDEFDGTAGIVGPCPLHWTTFDLTRHGMVISGHATTGLPQILLELAGDDIVAVGVRGLAFGRVDNLAAR